MKKLLLGTAIAMVLATASYAQTYTADDAAGAAKALQNPPGQDEDYPNDLLNGGPETFDTPDGRWADAWDLYKLVENYECRDETVELVISALTEDLEWIGNYLANGDGPVLAASYSRPKTKSEYEGIKIFLAILKDKPVCATPAKSTPAIPGGGSTPQQPQVDEPQQPSDPDDDPEPPGTCFTTANAVSGWLHLELDPEPPNLRQKPPPRWKQQTIGGKCVWYLKYYAINARNEGGWYIKYSDVPCTDPPPGSGASGGQYCPPRSDSTGLYSPGTDGTESQVARSTPADAENTVIVATPLVPWWFSSVTHPDASDHFFDNKPDSDEGPPALSDTKTADQPDSKTDSDETAQRTDQKSQPTERQSDSKPNSNAEKSDAKPNGNNEKSDSKSTGNTEKSDAKSTGNSEHSNAKSARTIERANAKSEDRSEHGTRTVAHEKREVSHQVAHTTEARHMSGVHEGGMREAGKHMGGTHAGGLGGLGGIHPGGLGGLHLGGFSGIHLGGFGRL